MKIDIDALMNSLPIMGVGLLGIFIVTGVLILGIYILKAITSKEPTADMAAVNENESSDSEKNGIQNGKPDAIKESALDLMKERKKTDFFEEEESNYISQDL